MKTAIVWLLVAVSSGGHNNGTVTPIMEYESHAACQETVNKNKTSRYRLECLEIIKEVGNEH